MKTKDLSSNLVSSLFYNNLLMLLRLGMYMHTENNIVRLAFVTHVKSVKDPEGKGKKNIWTFTSKNVCLV